MCGIFGALFSADVSSVDATAALQSIRYRGPDATDVLVRGGSVLGHNRLAVLDLTPGGAQPMTTADGGVSIVFNGEIYNHRELRRDLSGRGHTFASRSDTEVLLAAYRQWGDAVVDHIDGMFAFCVLDHGRQRALLARDRAGKKPLFYWRGDGGELRFGSEVKAILASGVRPEMDLASLSTLLVLGNPRPPRTMYRGIQELPPAHVLTVERGGSSAAPPRRYWRAPFDQPQLDVSAREAVCETRSLVEAAVERRLEADVPLGAFLSGGIDSTVIVACMARARGAGVKTFSIGFENDDRNDETRFARLAAKAFATDHTEFRVAPSSLELIERLVDLHDAPFGDASAIPTSIVSQLTRGHVTVALSGDGGDELFAGYPRFLAAEAAEWIPEPVRQGVAAALRRFPLEPGQRTVAARLRRIAYVASSPLAERLIGWNGYFPEGLNSLLRPEIADRLDLRAPWSDAEAVLDKPYPSRLSRILAHNFATYLPDDLLVKADRSSMLHSLELRAPFLDTRLVEYVARLPDRYKRRGRDMKWILKEAFADVLPEAIRERGKMGFGAPLDNWFRAELREYVVERLSGEARIYELVRREYVERLLLEHLSGKAAHGARLWLLLTLEVWLRSKWGRAAS